MDFIIDRKTWRCGGFTDNSLGNSLGNGHTKLLNEEGYMCCLGQVSLQLGVSVDEINGITSPQFVCCENDNFHKILIENNKNSDFAKQAIEINDGIAISQEDREKELQILFTEYDHTLTFKD